MPSASSASWYVHLQGENLGPLTAEKVIHMLTQNRVQFADFAWRPGYTKWIRISEIDEFAAHLPPYPETGIPDSAAKSGPKEEHKPAHRPAAEAEAPKEAPPAEPERAETKRAPRVPTRFLRIALSGKVVTQGHGSFEILNLAERGVFVASKAPLEIGTDLQFQLESPEFPEPLRMRGVVIRHGKDQEETGFAIEFVRLNPVHKSLIEQYVRNKAAQES